MLAIILWIVREREREKGITDYILDSSQSVAVSSPTLLTFPLYYAFFLLHLDETKIGLEILRALQILMCFLLVSIILCTWIIVSVWSPLLREKDAWDFGREQKHGGGFGVRKDEWNKCLSQSQIGGMESQCSCRDILTMRIQEEIGNLQELTNCWYSGTYPVDSDLFSARSYRDHQNEEYRAFSGERLVDWRDSEGTSRSKLTVWESRTSREPMGHSPVSATLVSPWDYYMEYTILEPPLKIRAEIDGSRLWSHAKELMNCTIRHSE